MLTIRSTSPINLFKLCENEWQDLAVEESGNEGNGDLKARRRRCGEIFLDKEDHTISFICTFCYKECYHLESLLRHLMHRHFSTTDEMTDKTNQCEALECIEIGDFTEEVNPERNLLKEEKGIGRELEKNVFIGEALEYGEDKVDKDEKDKNIKSIIKSLQKAHKLKRKCKVNEKKEILETPKTFICELCGQTFNKQTRFAAHLKIHKFGKRHACQFCDKKFADKCNLNTHVRRHLGIKPHVCTTCDKAFHTSTELKLHIRSHTGEKPFVCKECGKEFVSSSHLTNHMREHRNERLFVCLNCDKRFNTKKNLLSHGLSHSKERRFKCSICESAFNRPRNLQTHMKLHSGIKEYVCRICSKAFAQHAGLFSHMKTHKKDNRDFAV